MHAVRTDRNTRIALVTCAELPEADPDSRLVIEPLRKLGIESEPAVWSDASIDWDRFDLAIVRSTWDYVPRLTEFLAWSRRVPRLANTARVIEANTDKRYLATLAVNGVSVVPTTWLHPADPFDPTLLVEKSYEWVIKPAVSHSALDSGRYDLRVPRLRTLATIHASRLQREGRLVMLQPYMRGVDEEGETSLVYFGGVFSHAVRKAAALTGPETGHDQRFEPAPHRACDATEAQRALALRALAAIGGEKALYARVDLVPAADGSPVVIEVELTEPMLYLARHEAAPARFAAAIAALIGGRDGFHGTDRAVSHHQPASLTLEGP
jgi:glutathione synthase/RimK-type ligase-like ATP-grasp enzyme